MHGTSTLGTIDIHYFCAWGLQADLWSSRWLKACLHWICNAVFVVDIKSVKELCHPPPLGMDSMDTDQPPKGGGGFAWTINTHLQITQPGSKTITPLYQ